MSFLQEHNDILGRFETAWGATSGVAWPNKEFNPPVLEEGAKWVRITIKDDPPVGGDTPQLTIGTGLNSCRFAGQIIIQCFTDADCGHAQCMALAEQAGAAFLKWHSSNGVICRIPVIKQIGVDPQGWFQVNCTVPFIRDELI
jgi:hypothetical protein